MKKFTYKQNLSLSCLTTVVCKRHFQFCITLLYCILNMILFWLDQHKVVHTVIGKWTENDTWL